MLANRGWASSRRPDGLLPQARETAPTPIQMHQQVYVERVFVAVMVQPAQRNQGQAATLVISLGTGWLLAHHGRVGRRKMLLGAREAGRAASSSGTACHACLLRVPLPAATGQQHGRVCGLG